MPLVPTSYPMDWRTAIIFTWSGLRGAVGMVIALYIFLDPAISDQVRERELQRLGPPYHDEQTRANQTQAGRQQLERRGQREKEDRKQREEGDGMAQRAQGEGEKGNKGEGTNLGRRSVHSAAAAIAAAPFCRATHAVPLGASAQRHR